MTQYQAMDPRLAAFSKAKSSSSSPIAEPADATNASETAQAKVAPEPITEQSFTGPGARLITITKKLTSLIKEETSYLKNHKPQIAASLHGEKTRLMAEYRKTLNHLQLNQQLLGPKESPMRTFIRTLTDGFRDALKEHARIVIRMKAISEGIVKSISEEITKNTKPVMSYGANAAMRAPSMPQATSLSLNQVI